MEIGRKPNITGVDRVVVSSRQGAVSSPARTANAESEPAVRVPAVLGTSDRDEAPISGRLALPREPSGSMPISSAIPSEKEEERPAVDSLSQPPDQSVINPYDLFWSSFWAGQLPREMDSL